jgi:hypothetical protein
VSIETTKGPQAKHILVWGLASGSGLDFRTKRVQFAVGASRVGSLSQLALGKL